jgi:FkbH-like protein
MWQLDWGEEPGTGNLQDVRRAGSIESSAISGIYLLHWGEHCVECALPDCYKACSLYEPRKDKKCARFNYGIYSNPQFQGLYPYAADISFKRWAKLESEFEFGASTVYKLRWLDRIDRFLQVFVNIAGSLLEPVNKKRRINGLYFFLRQHLVALLSSTDKVENIYDEFIIDVLNPSGDDVQIVVECEQEALCYRDSITLKPGNNLHRIDFSEMNIDLGKRLGRIRLYPDNDAECRLIFSWLDFVKYSGAAERAPEEDTAAGVIVSQKADNKIKCVIWDLDNTVWQGILGELGADGVKVHSYIVDIMARLDERGIIQSVASKNDHEHAWAVLTDLGLDKYLLYPAINWQPKSENIKHIAKQLNISIDTFAFMDDSPFERAQVESELPMIRTYDPARLDDIFEQPEFDVAITSASKNRRGYYQAEISRKGFSTEASGSDYGTFLRQCNMQANIFIPTSNIDISRCLELLQRSNQLNLTTHRYTEKEFLETIAAVSTLSYATSVIDRFGEYGIVGVAIIDTSEQIPVLSDFVLSCRVAQKRVEHAWFNWITGILSEKGYTKLHADFLTTERNHILLEVMYDVGFCKVDEVEGGIRLELDFSKAIPESDIVSIADL